MRSRTVLIVGPRRCGKTLHAEALREHFGCAYVFDNWRPSHGIVQGALMLTSIKPGGDPLPYRSSEFDAFDFADAMRQMTDAHSALLAS